MSVIFKDHSPQVKAMMEKKIAEALERIGLEWLKNVTETINTRFGRPIVDTGRYRASMKYEVDLSRKVVYVGTDIEYSPFIEFGTSRMAARPVIKTSVLEFIPAYEAAVRKVLGEGWSVSVAV